MSMLLSSQETQLVLVDYQAKLMPVIHQGSQVLANAVRLAKIAKLLQLPIIGTEQNPEKLGPNDAELKSLCQKTLSKMHFGACEDGLVELLRTPPKPMGNARSLPKHIQRKQEGAEERNTIVIAGCEAHVCLLQTALVFWMKSLMFGWSQMLAVLGPKLTVMQPLIAWRAMVLN